MPYNLVHAGTALQRIDVAGIVSSLTLPAGVTISASKRSVFAVFGETVVAVYGPSVNLSIDTTTSIVSPMSLTAPATAPTIATGAAGVLSGNYSFKMTFAQIDGGVVISESPFVGPTATLTVSSQKISLSAIAVSASANVNARRFYRTTSNGSVYFYSFAINDNTTTTATENLADAGLSTTAAPTDLGNPAGTTTADYATNIIAWGDRLWLTSSGDPDLIFFSGANKFYAWNATQFLVANPIGQSSTGVVAFLRRRSQLGIAKATGIWQITGDSPETYQCHQIWQGVGVKAPQSVVVINDVVYWLAENGVYSWGPEGIDRVSKRISPWFTTDLYFNRALFSSAFAVWNPRENTYELHVASPTSGVCDLWVSYDIDTQRWLGPHTTTAFTPSAAGLVDLAGGTVKSLVGSSAGYVYITSDTHNDDSVGIPLSITTAWHSSGVPEVTKVFGQLSMYTGVEPAGILTVTPYVGGTDASAGASLSHSLTTGEEQLGRVGQGRLVSLAFTHSTADERVRLYGYRIPVVPVGIR